MLNATVFARAVEEQIREMTGAERFRFFARLYDGAPYVGGREHPFRGADCSGTVCGPLYLMGYDIRTTADDLYRSLFTHPAADVWDDDSRILAVFYRTIYEREHFGATVPAGTATHVTPVVGRGLVINAFDPIRIDTSAHVYDWYSKRGFTIEWRELNWSALITAHRTRNHFDGIDTDLVAMRAA